MLSVISRTRDERPVLERLGPDQGPVEPGFPAAGGADVIEVLPGGLDQAVGGAGDLLVGGGLEQQPQRVAGFLDVAGHAVGDQALGRHGDELGDEQFPLPGRDRDAEQLVGQFGVAAHLGAGAGDGLAGFLDPVPPGRLVDERERGAGALAFEFGGAEGVGAHDAHGGGAQGAGIRCRRAGW